MSYDYEDNNEYMQTRKILQKKNEKKVWKPFTP